jgi:hypothetical protein
MTYTNEQRQAIADVFKKVHRRMENTPPWVGFKYQHSRYICDNIAEVDCDNLDKHLADQVINERIGHKFSVDRWLRDEGHISADFEHAAHFGHPKSFESVQMYKYRLRWLKSLIAEFSAEEKQS